MAQARKGGQPPTIVIVKKVKGGHGGHHGGAWKIAYSDFVTAMMAFFLLMWLLNTTTEQQRNGLADYFAPTAASFSQSGAGGVLGGQSLAKDGARLSDAAPLVEPPPSEESLPGEAGGGAEGLSEQALQEALEAREKEQFEKTARELRQAIEEDAELAPLRKNLVVDQTEEGLRIQLVDQDGTSMFASGGSRMSARAQALMDQVAQALAGTTQKISISGHTDATPFRGGGGTYSNWELSADRANASRRALLGAGLAEDRIANVVGRADREPLVPEEPTSERNRRISIVLLRTQPPPAADARPTAEGRPAVAGQPAVPPAGTGAEPAAPRPARPRPARNGEGLPPIEGGLFGR